MDTFKAATINNNIGKSTTLLTPWMLLGIVSAVLGILVVLLVVCIISQAHQYRARLGLIRIWVDHVLYLRLYMVACLSGHPNQKEISERLLKYLAEITDRIGRHFGEAARKRAVPLFIEHVGLADSVIDQLVKEQDPTDAIKEWKSNAAKIEQQLPMLQLKGKMVHHLNTMALELVAMHQGKWQQDLNYFDQSVDQAYDIAHHLSNRELVAKFSIM